MSAIAISGSAVSHIDVAENIQFVLIAWMRDINQQIQQ